MFRNHQQKREPSEPAGPPPAPRPPPARKSRAGADAPSPRADRSRWKLLWGPFRGDFRSQSRGAGSEQPHRPAAPLHPLSTGAIRVLLQPKRMISRTISLGITTEESVKRKIN